MNIILVCLTLLSLHTKPILYEYQKQIFSQFGEDGIIEEIFNNIGFESKVFLEFGGYHGALSNSEYMMSKYNIKGIFIEADHESCKKLAKYMSKYNAKIIETFVDAEGTNTLENILLCNNISFNIDMLSIDIDGNDYWVFNSLDKLKPRVIICEYNFTIPPHIDIYQKYLPGKTWTFGSSVKSLARIAAEKGYTLVATTVVNAFFVRNDLIDKLNTFDLNYDQITNANQSGLAYCIIDPRGDYLIVSSKPGRNELEAFPYFYGFSGNKVSSNEIIEYNTIVWDNFEVKINK